MNNVNRAVFLDRDGVINAERGYIYDWKDFCFLPGVIDAMRKLADAEYVLIIVSNQSGIARGYFSEAQYIQLDKRIRYFLRKRNVLVKASYYCPHHPEGIIERFSFKCDCRKPAPGMLLRAASDHQIEMGRSILIGDKVSDLTAAESAGVGSFYQITQDKKNGASAQCHGRFESLEDCVNYIVD